MMYFMVENALHLKQAKSEFVGTVTLIYNRIKHLMYILFYFMCVSHCVFVGPQWSSVLASLASNHRLSPLCGLDFHE